MLGILHVVGWIFDIYSITGYAELMLLHVQIDSIQSLSYVSLIFKQYDRVMLPNLFN